MRKVKLIDIFFKIIDENTCNKWFDDDFEDIMSVYLGKINKEIIEEELKDMVIFENFEDIFQIPVDEQALLMDFFVAYKLGIDVDDIEVEIINAEDLIRIAGIEVEE